MLSDLAQFPEITASSSDGSEVRHLLTLSRPELRCVFDLGPRVSSSESVARFGKPDLTGDVDRGPGKPSPESRDQLDRPGFVGSPLRAPEWSGRCGT